MTTIYLHIGIPKTATTTLQYVFFKNREKLLEKGFLYPLSGSLYNSRHSHGHPYWSLYGHLNLVRGLSKNNNRAYDATAGNWEELYQEIQLAKTNNVLISAETFYFLDFDQIYLVRNYLSEYNVKILVYLRKQDSFFQSHYCQDIKMCNYFDDISEYIKEKKNYGDYYQKLEYWSSLFGKENIIVRIFEKEQLINNSILDDFWSSIDLCVDSIERQSYEGEGKNYSPGIKLVKLINSFNKIAIKKMSISPWKLKNIYYRTFLNDSQFSIMLSQLPDLLPDFLIDNELLSIQERVHLMKEFEESNRKVAQEYLGRSDGTLFYRELN
jgi:hypothetical protein